MSEFTEKDMRLPEGRTCADCAHIRYCIGLFGCDETNTSCDWAPSRFYLRPAAPDSQPAKESK